LKRGQTIAGKSNCDDLSFIDEQDQKQLLEGEDQIAMGEFENLEKQDSTSGQQRRNRSSRQRKSIKPSSDE